MADRELRHGEGRGSRGARVERQGAEGDEARARGIHVVVDLGCGGELPPAGGEVTGIARLEVRGGADADEPGPAARPDERIGGIGVLEQVAQRGDFAGDDA